MPKTEIFWLHFCCRQSGS